VNVSTPWRLCAVLLFVVACGGAQTQTNELPPANPEAVREYNAATRLLSRRGARAASRARTRLERAVELDPNLWEARYDLGVVQRRAGELEQARASFEAAIAVQPSAPEPRLAAAEVAYELGDRSAAARQLRALVEGHPGNLEARVALAVVLREDESWDDALAQAREVLVRDPTSTRALLEIGRVYRARELFDVSRLVLQKALDLADEGNTTLRAEILSEQGLLELARGDTQAAFAAFELAIASEAAFAPARMNMGAVLLRAGDFAGAKTQYEAVLGNDEANIDARIGLGIAFRGEGDHSSARQNYQRVLDADERHPDALFNMAVLQADFLDQRPAARAKFVRYLSLAPRNHPGREEAERYVREIPDPAAPGGAP
jgi:tetratricopeptide (TPR) repeat protein